MKTIKKVFCVFVVSMLANGLVVIQGLAANLTPEQYINLEIAVRAITLQEVKEWASGNETATNYKQLIRKQYQSYGVNAGSHIKYGNKNQQAITRWLQSNLDKQAELDRLTSEFKLQLQLSEQDSAK